MDAMILSAGLGVRMRPLTDSTPKALLEVGSHRLIEYHLLNLAQSGISNVVINTSYLAAMFVDALGDGKAYGVNITYSHEGDTPLETGGGILKALPKIRSDPFLIVNADIWTDFSLKGIQYQEGQDGCLVMVDNPRHNPNGDFMLSDARLRLPQEGSNLNSLTYSGIAALRKYLFEDTKDPVFPLYPIFRESILRGKLAGQYHDGDWIDIGTPERLQSLAATLQSKQISRSVRIR
ncbi:MAG: nucleotidyltransferase family protein [Acidiferrobacterales bacterium]|nr:nucleotidyltransferase family protein [Acidiferrobacterales bacterium]